MILTKLARYKIVDYMVVEVDADECCVTDCMMDAIRDVLSYPNETCLPITRSRYRNRPAPLQYCVVQKLTKIKKSQFTGDTTGLYYRLDVSFDTIYGPVDMPVRYMDSSDLSISSGCAKHADILLKQWCEYFNNGSYTDNGYSYRN